DDSGNNAGHVRIYQWDGNDWIQMGADIDGELTNNLSGYSISMNNDGSRIVIGAPFNSDNGFRAGHARVYEWQDDAWVQLGADIDGKSFGDRSGWSVSINGDGSMIAIGADQAFSSGFNPGYVSVYQWNGNDWVQISNDINGQSAADRFGRSVSMNADGSKVIIGANFSDNNGTNSGHVSVYDILIPSLVVSEDTTLAITEVSVTDADGNLATTRLQVNNGVLNVTLSGTATISAGANGSNDLTISGNETDINNTLATLTYQGNLNFNGSDTLTVTSTDSSGTPLSDVDTVDITVNAINDAPVISAGSTLNYTENDSATAI
ncbi:hypothetical protein, partial [Cysteiniphilum halobium]|uniref:hypothetical protein n=1 Tax=Cysteiniphilum halobium TaxID=2219059 RepID=UPI001AAD7213